PTAPEPRMPKIAYREHPAFRSLDVAPTQPTEDLRRALDEIGQPLAALAALGDAVSEGRSDGRQVRDLAKRSFQVAGQGFAHLLDLLSRSRSDWSEWEAQTLRRWSQRMALEYSRLVRY